MQFRQLVYPRKRISCSQKKDRNLGLYVTIGYFLFTGTFDDKCSSSFSSHLVDCNIRNFVPQKATGRRAKRTEFLDFLR